MKCILIVEDDGFIANALESKLEKTEFEVMTVRDGSEVAGVLAKKKPDLILLDLVMPIMDGFAVLEYLKGEEKYKNIPVVVLTNLEQEEDRNKVMAVGATDYLVKTDFSIIEIIETIRKYL